MKKKNIFPKGRIEPAPSLVRSGLIIFKCKMSSMLPSPVRTLVHCVADLLTSSHPQMSASHLLGLQVRANRPSQLSYQSTCIVTWGATNQDMLHQVLG